MDNVVARLGRENHLNNLTSKLPLLTTLYGLQCFMVMNMAPNIDIGTFATYMGIILIMLIGSLYVHDKYHHVLLYKDHIMIYFEPLNIYHTIKYEDIDDILTPKQECAFSSIIFKLKSEENITIHFVDFPLEVKRFISELKAEQLEKSHVNAA